MAKLHDVRRRFPVEDRAAYEAAYAEAELAARVGEFLHRLRTGAGLTSADLAARMGLDEDVIDEVEEGCGSLSIDFFDRLCRALGGRVTLRVGDEELELDRSSRSFEETED
jgi:transcriptional regulator with XRE-family HTH domain